MRPETGCDPDMDNSTEYELTGRMDRAIALHARGLFSEAILEYKSIMLAQPGQAEAERLLQLAQAKLEEKNNTPEQLLVAPDGAAAYCSFGSVLLDIEKLEMSERCFLKALELNPSCFPAYLGLGWICYLRLDIDKAEKCWKLAYQISPEHYDALVNIAMVQVARGFPDQALPVLRAVLSKEPSNAQAIEQLIKANALTSQSANPCDILYAHGHIAAAEHLARQSLKNHYSLEDHNRLLMCLLASPQHSAKDYFDETRSWALSHGGEKALKAPHDFSNSRQPDKRLKIGIVGDYFVGVIGFYTLVPFFRLYDRDQLELFCYNFGPGKEILEPIVDHYRDVAGQEQQQFYEIVRDDEIDIMLDINGRLRSPNFFAALIRQPAPIIVNWFNLTATVGHKSYNYLITDDYSLQPGEESLYVEKVFRMPTGTISSWDMGPPPVVPRPPKEKNGYVTFGSFANFFKVNALVMSSWANLLERVPDARLYLKSPNLCLQQERTRVADYFRSQGISPDRLILEGESPYEIMKKQYERVDIAIDTFPYSSGSSTINALWHGVPVLAISGNSWRERNSASILAGAGLTSLIASDVADYLSKAEELAGMDETLADYRANLGEYLSTTPQWQTGDFARNFEARLRMIWHNWIESAGEEGAWMH